jgi:NAD(P)-dependent dehydrogenase (short-subunit alcohol dehydrogenase family)
MNGPVLITGASGGIGRKIATHLAYEGWHVIATGRNEEGLQQTAAAAEGAPGAITVRSLDVTDDSQIECLVRDLDAEGLAPNGLVNNSGVSGPSKPLWEVTPQEWDDTMAVNLRGVFFVCRAVLPGMLERGRGSIVNIGSITGKNPLEHRTPYASSKAALIGLTKTLAHDAGKDGVRVNLVSPGAVWGERLEWVVKSQAEATGRSEADVRTGASAQAALKRFTKPEEVAQTVEFLLSDRASGITGVDVTVAAGYVTN